jgi:2-C-methyl-D-erythritol 4-phosphate cytidylyltransferase
MSKIQERGLQKSKKILKLELVNNFHKKIELVAGHLEIIKIVAKEDLRYAHWAEIHEELGMKIQS